LNRPPPSYTVDTLRALREEHGSDAELVLILGHDQWRAFDAWHRPDEIRSLATLAVMDRGGEGVEDEPGVVRVPVGRIDVSSSEVRDRAAAGESIGGLVPDGVAEIVRRERLYRG
jgi:nicotinate-nucleotide adenylyltransferase